MGRRKKRVEPEKLDKLWIDVMADGYYVCTIRVPRERDRRIDITSILNDLLEKRPTLKYKRVNLVIDNLTPEELRLLSSHY